MSAVWLKSVWLGTFAAREKTFAELARVLAEFNSAARRVGGRVVPAGIGLSGYPAMLGGDTHVIEVLSATEQEVLANLIRTHVPVLIAMTGRGVTAAAAPRDWIGSRWLADSKTHVATRYLASTQPEHLKRVAAELRRRDGVSRLDRMDVAPGQMPDGTLTVTIRCIDSAASVAAARSHALVLAALALKARRLVRGGSRIGNTPQPQLANNRARAIAAGLRARFERLDKPGSQRAGPHDGDRVEARAAVRHLLLDLCVEFGNLEAAAEELAPVILPVELPRLGLRRIATEDELLARSAARGDSTLASAASAGLVSSTPGGHLLASAKNAAPGRVSILLGSWQSNLAAGASPDRTAGREPLIMPPAVDVELILDVRNLRTPPQDRNGFLALWARVERALRGRDLRGSPACVVDAGAEGKLRLEVTRIASDAGTVSAQTRFSVVAVREEPQLRHRCRECADQSIERYGPFRCSVREGGEHRVCDLHVSILDGSLMPTCGAHRPRCRDCEQPATFRCAGRACRHQTAWCDQHRRSRPHESDVDYCPSCHTREFPRCEKPGCTGTGTVACEYLSRAFQACGQPVCALHAWRWQVFGGERLGLGRCSAHADVTRLPPAELIFQIVAGAAARRRRERLPSLYGFAHTFRRAGQPNLALDYKRVMGMLTRLAADLDRTVTGLAAADLIRKTWPTWERQLKDIEAAAAEGERLVTRLKQVVRSEVPGRGPALAAAISLAEYRPARVRSGARRALLFVHVPPDKHELFTGTDDRHRRRYEALLGVRVRIEGGKRR